MVKSFKVPPPPFVTHVIMSSLLKKKILILTVTASFFFLYVSSSIRFKRENLRKHWDLFFENQGGPEYIIRKCKKMRPVLITFKATKSYQESAEYLYKTDLNYDNICNSSNIDICNEEDTSLCKTIDIKLFISNYFKEIIAEKVILRDTGQKSYDIYKDKEGPLNIKPKEFKILGMMIGLTIIHETYLEISFASHFLYNINSSQDLFVTLSNFDPEQYKIYQKIRDSAKWGYSKEKEAKFMPNSSKPFKELNDPDPLAEVYQNSDFPLAKAAKQIFIIPYEKTRELIFEGMYTILNRRYYFVMGANYWDRYSLINFNRITASVPGNLFIHNWKDNSDYNNKSRIFWLALRLLDSDRKMKVYKKVTGFDKIPAGGFARLPRTQIVIGTGEMFPEPFKIVINPNLDRYELEKEMRKI